MDAPHSMPAPITTRPGRRTWLVQPLVAAPMIAPNAGAAVSSPNVAGPPWKCSLASAGNSPAGIPKIIALVSISSIPPMTPLRRTYLNPSASACSPGRWPPGAGGSGRMKCTATPKTAKPTASMA